ncbi:MAG TPA: amidohydrolase, partial [Clostridia bacterium]|nr:amidohydrolase [Clostridia bacterium]
YIKIIGKSGHASVPHYAKDSILAAAQTLLGIQQIVSRQVDPHEATVISVSSINGGTGINVLPEKVQMAGTTRYFKQELQSHLHSSLRQMVSGITSACGCEYEFEYHNGYEATVNSPRYAELVRSIAAVQLGKEKVFSNLLPAMVSEDFSYYLKHVPGCYFWLGCGNENIQSSLHSSTFDFDEKAMAVGAALMADAVWSFINTE